MVLQVPTVNPRLANITAPQLPKINVLGALQQGFGRGDIDRQNQQAEQLQGVLQAQGPAALGGDVDALNEIRMLGEDGFNMASQIQQVLDSQDSKKVLEAQKKIEKHGLFLASILKLEPPEQRRKLFDESHKLMSAGDRKAATEFLHISQLKDDLDIQGEVESALVIASAGNKYLQGFVDTGAAEEKLRSEFNKEERQQAKTTVNRLTKRATDINSDFDKINSLLNQNSRAANASVLQLIARLASPGIVTEKEAGALAGGATPLLALAAKFDQGGDEDTAKLIRRSMDPNNPANFDTEGLKALARGLTSSEVPFLMKELEGAKNRARPNLSAAAFVANFGDTSAIDSLSRFVEAPDTGDEDQVTQGAAADLSDEELLKLLRNVQ